MNYKDIIRLILCWPLFFGTLVSFICYKLWGKKLEWHNHILVSELSENSWPMRSWFKKWGGVTFGYGVMIAPGQSEVLNHEFRHVKQLEGGTILGLFLGIASWIFVFKLYGLTSLLFFWFFTPSLFYLCYSLIAELYNQNPYKDNLLEEDAEANKNE